MAEIIGLRGGPVPREPVPNVVSALEEWLALAKEGRVRAVAMVVVKDDNTVLTGWQKADVPGDAPATTLENHALGNGVLTLAVEYAMAGGRYDRS